MSNNVPDRVQVIHDESKIFGRSERSDIFIIVVFFFSKCTMRDHLVLVITAIMIAAFA